MAETTQQVVAGVYALLRRPSQAKLAYTDVQERMHDILRGYVQEAALEGRDQRTAVAEVQITADDIDYLLDLPNVPDFEPVRLERALTYADSTRTWSEVQLVPFSAWERHYSQPYLAASIYGGFDGRTRIKLNLDSTEFGQSLWRLSYRVPLLTVLQMGESPPLPNHFMPMLKLETALASMPMVRDDSKEWKEWLTVAQSTYALQLQEWKQRWHEYLTQSLEPSQVPIRPFNDYRRGYGRRNPRAYLPIGS